MVSLQEQLSQEIKSIATSSDIELTAEEIKEAIEAAKIKKAVAIEKEQQASYAEFVEQEIRRPWGHEDLKTFVINRARDISLPFTEDAKNKDLITSLSYYFTGNELFEKCGPKDKKPWSLNKGLMLCGGIGTGKTTLMKGFNKNKRRCYTVVSCRHIASKYAEMGADVLSEYSGKRYTVNSRDTFYQNEIGFCFDDLGTEESKKNYGNQANVMADILLNRYDNTNVPWHYTHATTNLTPEEIEEYYGTRVRSRLKEMFNMIAMTGEDRRK